MDKQRANEEQQEEQQLVEQWEGAGTVPQAEDDFVVSIDDPDATWKMIR